MSPRAPRSGPRDPGRDSQAVFRAVMDAMARPGTLGRIEGAFGVPAPLSPGCAAVASTLCDFETPLWLDPGLAAVPAVARFLRFETAAPLVAEPGAAAFAIVGDPLRLPALESFALGTLDFPDRSTTLIVAVDHLTEDGDWVLSGPGIAETARFGAAPLARDFAARRAALAGLFPRGLDMIFVAGNRLAAVPRTTRIREA